MSNTQAPCPILPEDMRATPLLLDAPLSYRAQIDTTTRQVLNALLLDVQDHLAMWHDPEQDLEGFMHVIYMAETLTALLNRTEQAHRPPDWLST